MKYAKSGEQLDDLLKGLQAPDVKVRDKTRKALKPWMQKRKTNLKCQDYLTIWKNLSQGVCASVCMCVHVCMQVCTCVLLREHACVGVTPSHCTRI